MRDGRESCFTPASTPCQTARRDTLLPLTPAVGDPSTPLPAGFGPIPRAPGGVLYSPQAGEDRSSWGKSRSRHMVDNGCQSLTRCRGGTVARWVKSVAQGFAPQRDTRWDPQCHSKTRLARWHGGPPTLYHPRWQRRTTMLGGPRGLADRQGWPDAGGGVPCPGGIRHGSGREVGRRAQRHGLAGAAQGRAATKMKCIEPSLLLFRCPWSTITLLSPAGRLRPQSREDAA
jgi:hypothetical protein